MTDGEHLEKNYLVGVMFLGPYLYFFTVAISSNLSHVTGCLDVFVPKTVISSLLFMYRCTFNIFKVVCYIADIDDCFQCTAKHAIHESTPRLTNDLSF